VAGYVKNESRRQMRRDSLYCSDLEIFHFSFKLPMAEAEKIMSLDGDCVHVELTEQHLDVMSVMNRVRSPKAGAIVIFAGVIPRIRDQVLSTADTAEQELPETHLSQNL
jgi:hypothetical protein